MKISMKWEGPIFPYLSEISSLPGPKDAVQTWPCWRLWRDEDGQPKLATMAEDFENCDGPVVNCQNDQKAAAGSPEGETVVAGFSWVFLFFYVFF